MKHGRGHVPRVFVSQPLATGQEIELAEDKRHHLATVLRLANNAPLVVFNGDGHEYAARIVEATRKTMRVAVVERGKPQRESALQVTLVQAVARGDRMDFALAKAVELGVHALQPVFTQRSQVRLDGARLEKKQIHWQAVVESAAEQSGRLIRPKLAPACDLAELLAQPEAISDNALRLMLAPRASRNLADLAPSQAVTLLVGPESGLSDAEITQAESSGWQSLALGPRILRTETAGMAALAALQTAWGDLAS